MENPECTSNASSDLLKSMRTTSYARYDAHKRCERLNNSSLFALTSASMLLIFMGIIDNFSPEISPFLNKSHLELFSILTSITILVLSLVVSFASYSLKSERYFRTGNEIGELCDRLRFLKEADVKAITDIAEQYYLLRKNSDNHQGYNYKKGRLERKRQSNISLDSSDNLTIIELIGYWSPIMAFYSVSLLSFIVFAYEILKFAHYA